MLLTVVLSAIHSFDKIWPIVIFFNVCSLSDLIYSDKLLIKLTCSIMNAAKRLNNCNIDIIIILDRFFNSMQKVVIKDPTGVWPISKVPMH